MKFPDDSIDRKEHVKPNGPNLRTNPKSPDIRNSQPRFQLEPARKAARVKATKNDEEIMMSHQGVGSGSMFVFDTDFALVDWVWLISIQSDWPCLAISDM